MIGKNEKEKSFEIEHGVIYKRCCTYAITHPTKYYFIIFRGKRFFVHVRVYYVATT